MDLKQGDAIPETYKEWFRADIRHAEKWRKEAKTDYEFRDSHQWTEDEEKTLEDRQQPPTVFNLILPIVDAVCGQEISNRQEVRFIPREEGDVKANEIYTAAAQWFRDRAAADDNDSEAFRDTITGGMGWTETRLDYEKNPDGDLRDDRLDPFEMAWDYNATKKNLKDSTRFWHVRKIVTSEARALVEGEWEDEELDADWAADGVWDGDDPHVSEKVRNRSRRNADGTEELTEVILVHCQWMERETFWRVPIPSEDPMGKSSYKDFTPEEFKTFGEQFTARYGTPPVGARKHRKQVWYRAYLGNKVLKVTPTACPDHSNFKCITAKRDQTKRQWFGLVRVMRDPNSWANKFFSQMLHIINSSAKGGIMAERGQAFDNDNEAEESWARQDRITWMKPGALAGQNPKWAQKPQMVFPQGIQFLMEYAADSVRRTGGVSMELLGQKETDQAGVLEYQRRQAGLTILAPLFDSLKAYRRDQGELILYYIQHDLSDGRLIKVVGKDKAQYLPLVKQATLEYDIIVDDMPNSPNQKEMTWQIITQILPVIKDMLSPETMLMFLESSPLPSAVIDKMKAKAEEQAQSPMTQLQQRMAALEAQVLASKDQLQQAQAQKALADAQAALQPDGVDPQAELEIERQKAAGKLDIEREKARASIETERAKAGAQIDIARQKQAGEMQIRGAEMAFDHKIRGAEAAQDAAIKERTAESGIAVQERTADAGIAIKAKQAKAAAKQKPAR